VTCLIGCARRHRIPLAACTTWGNLAAVVLPQLGKTQGLLGRGNAD
jgi:hypothetical protein